MFWKDYSSDREKGRRNWEGKSREESDGGMGQGKEDININ